MSNLVLKNQVMRGTVNAGKNAFEAAVRDLGVFMKRWLDAVRNLITGRYPVEQHLDLVMGKAGGIPGKTDAPYRQQQDVARFNIIAARH